MFPVLHHTLLVITNIQNFHPSEPDIIKLLRLIETLLIADLRQEDLP